MMPEYLELKLVRIKQQLGAETLEEVEQKLDELDKKDGDVNGTKIMPKNKIQS